MTMGMSWFSLESIRNWNVPVELDGVQLKLHQAKVLVGMVERLMDDAGFGKADAVEHAVAAFRCMYDLSEGEWRAKETIQLKDHGMRIKNKFYQQDQKERIMARVRVEIAEQRRRRKMVQGLIEAGRRNSTKDKQAIDSALAGLFDVLNRTDQEAALKVLGKKVGRNIRFKRQEP